jgi:hypothetical protein
MREVAGGVEVVRKMTERFGEKDLVDGYAWSF